MLMLDSARSATGAGPAARRIDDARRGIDDLIVRVRDAVVRRELG